MTEPNPLDLIREVRAEMARQSLTAAKLAETSDISPQTLSRRFRNPDDFTLDELVRICAALGVPLRTFFDRAMAEDAA